MTTRPRAVRSFPTPFLMRFADRIDQDAARSLQDRQTTETARAELQERQALRTFITRVARETTDDE